MTALDYVTTEPIIDPGQAKDILDMLVMLTSGQPWQVYVIGGIGAITICAAIARMIISKTESKKDDHFFIRYFGWIPRMPKGTFKLLKKLIKRGKR